MTDSLFRLTVSICRPTLESRSTEAEEGIVVLKWMKTDFTSRYLCNIPKQRSGSARWRSFCFNNTTLSNIKCSFIVTIIFTIIYSRNSNCSCDRGWLGIQTLDIGDTKWFSLSRWHPRSLNRLIYCGLYIAAIAASLANGICSSSRLSCGLQYSPFNRAEASGSHSTPNWFPEAGQPNDIAGSA